jgi:glycosyltransferase involved in cell wall biosynthesis
MPQVTVIIPTYNRAAFLGEAVRSVLGQSFVDFELIVVDDGSTDDTPSLLGAIGDPRLRVLRREHRGIGASINAALQLARGQYVARLDSDDVWRPELLRTLVAELDARPEIGLAYGKGQAMDASGQLLLHFQGMRPRFPDDALRSALYDDCTCTIATVVRREHLEQVGGYDESLPANEDWDLTLRLAQQCRFAFVDQVLAQYRWHEGNLTGLRSPGFDRVMQTRTAPLDKFFAQPNLPAAIAAMRPVTYENVYLFRGQRWLDAGSYTRARRELLAALRVSETRPRTTLRILWFAFVVRCFGRTRLGLFLIPLLTRLRRRWLREEAVGRVGKCSG